MFNMKEWSIHFFKRFTSPYWLDRFFILPSIK